MLQALRSGAKSPVMKFFLIFLAGGFALWGVGDVTTGLIGGSDKAISAGKISVSPREVAKEFERTRRTYLPNSSVEEALNGGLLNEVTGALSRDVLIRAENNRLGLTVTRSMQRDAIVNEASFKDELGEFSEGRFMQALASAGLNETDYLRRVDGALMRDQLVDALSSGARFEDASARLIAAYDLERRTVRLTSFAVEPEKIAAPDAATLDAYFQENKSSYDAPELRAVQFASISAEMISANIEITEADIASAFADRLDEFSTPEIRKIRQMVFDDKALAETARTRSAKGESFAEIASDMLGWTETDIDLGNLRKDALDPALAEAAFTAKIGKAVGPVESAFGQHVLIIDEITAGGNPSLDDVRPQITDTLRAERAVDLLYERANALEDALGTGATLAEAATKVGGRVDAIANIDRNGLDMDGNPVTGEIADLAQDSAVLDLIWTTPVAETSVIQEGSDDMFFVVKIDSQTERRERAPSEVKSRTIADWKMQQAIIKARALATAVVKGGNNTGTISSPFRRNGSGLDHQAAGLIAREAFQQAVGTSGVVETGSEAIAVQSVEIMPTKDEEIKTTAQYVSDVMATALRDDLMNMMLISLSERHDLQLNTGSVNQLLIGTQ